MASAGGFEDETVYDGFCSCVQFVDAGVLFQEPDEVAVRPIGSSVVESE